MEVDEVRDKVCDEVPKRAGVLGTSTGAMRRRSFVAVNPVGGHRASVQQSTPRGKLWARRDAQR